jgi:hypothetical protein
MERALAVSLGDCGSYPCRVVTTTFTKIGMELEFISEKLSRDVEILATDHDDMLTIEDLFCDSRGKTAWRSEKKGKNYTKKMAFPVDDNSFLEGGHC